MVRRILLRALADGGHAMGATRLARELELHGISLQARMVRNHLERMDRSGLTENRGRSGRFITPNGLKELEHAAPLDRFQLAAARMDELAFRMNLDLLNRRGDVVLNLTRLRADDATRAAEVLRAVLKSALRLPSLLALGLEGEVLAGERAPYGFILLGTVCNVTLTGALRAAGIPVTSRFAGLLEFRDGSPLRFTHVMHYDGTTLDPAQVLVGNRLTRVLDFARSGDGCVVAGFREIPAVALPEAQRVIALLERMGLGGVLAAGRPGQPLLGFPVVPGRAGLAVAGGINAVAALAESGIETESRLFAALHPVDLLFRPSELDRRVATSRRVHQRLAALMDNPPPDREYLHEE